MATADICLVFRWFGPYEDELFEVREGGENVLHSLTSIPGFNGENEGDAKGGYVEFFL